MRVCDDHDHDSQGPGEGEGGRGHSKSHRKKGSGTLGISLLVPGTTAISTTDRYAIKVLWLKGPDMNESKIVFLQDEIVAVFGIGRVHRVHFSLSSMPLGLILGLVLGPFFEDLSDSRQFFASPRSQSHLLDQLLFGSVVSPSFLGFFPFFLVSVRFLSCFLSHFS